MSIKQNLHGMPIKGKLYICSEIKSLRVRLITLGLICLAYEGQLKELIMVHHSTFLQLNRRKSINLNPYARIQELSLGVGGWGSRHS